MAEHLKLLNQSPGWKLKKMSIIWEPRPSGDQLEMKKNSIMTGVWMWWIYVGRSFNGGADNYEVCDIYQQAGCNLTLLLGSVIAAYLKVQFKSLL